MKFYESGDNSKPVIFLFPGTCCLYSSFYHILDRLHSFRIHLPLNKILFSHLDQIHHKKLLHSKVASEINLCINMPGRHQMK